MHLGFGATSMPRVGSSRISSFGSAFSHLLSMTFCWLPPDSLATSVQHRRRADAEPLAELLRGGRLLPLTAGGPTGSGSVFSIGSEMFDDDRHGHDKAKLSPVLGSVGDAKRKCLLGRLDLVRLALRR